MLVKASLLRAPERSGHAGKPMQTSMNGRVPAVRYGVIMALILACGVTGALASPLTPFRNEFQARRHCPADVVVWLDLGKGTYYTKQQRRYGRGLTGSFVCREEARTNGYRRSLLGVR
jgi:hypothetical protein